LRKGYIELNGKKVHVNQSGGILNTQAAISLSAATGLIDILEHAQKNPQARTFLFWRQRRPRYRELGGHSHPGRRKPQRRSHLLISPEERIACNSRARALQRR
jgi:hypothetical protein